MKGTAQADQIEFTEAQVKAGLDGWFTTFGNDGSVMKRKLSAEERPPEPTSYRRGSRPVTWTDAKDRQIIEMSRDGAGIREIRTALKHGTDQVRQRIEFLRKVGRL